MEHRELREMEALRNVAPTNEELLEAAERADAGHKLAYPRLFDQSTAGEPEQPVARIDHKTAKTIGSELLDMQGSIFRTALALPLEGHMDIHLALNGLGNEVERLLKVVSERWEDE